MKRPSGIFSPEGKQIAFAVLEADDWSVVVGDQKQKSFDAIWPDTIVFSSDSKRCSYLGRRKEGVFLVVDGQEYGPYKQFKGVSRPASGIWGLFGSRHEPNPVKFSADGRRFAHIATRNDGSMVCIVDGTISGAYEDVTNIAFSPSGKHWAVLAKKKRKIQFRRRRSPTR